MGEVHSHHPPPLQRLLNQLEEEGSSIGDVTSMVLTSGSCFHSNHSHLPFQWLIDHRVSVQQSDIRICLNSVFFLLKGYLYHIFSYAKEVKNICTYYFCLIGEYDVDWCDWWLGNLLLLSQFLTERARRSSLQCTLCSEERDTAEWTQSHRLATSNSGRAEASPGLISLSWTCWADWNERSQATTPIHDKIEKRRRGRRAWERPSQDPAVNRSSSPEACRREKTQQNSIKC